MDGNPDDENPEQEDAVLFDFLKELDDVILGRVVLADDAFDCLGVVESGVSGHLRDAAGDVGGKEFDVHGLVGW